MNRFPSLHFLPSVCGLLVLFAATHVSRAADAPIAPDSAPPFPDEKLTLDAAIAEAFAQNPALGVIEADVDSARGEVVTAQTKPARELTIAPGWKRVNEGDGSHNELKATVALSQTFLNRGRRDLVIAIAERNVELRGLAIDGLRLQLAAEVRQSFYELLAAQSIVALRREQIESAKTFQSAAIRRVQSGYSSEFEAVKSSVDVLNATKLLRAAEGEIAVARVELNILLGRDPASPLEVTGSLDPTASTPALPDLIARSLANSPGLRVQAMQAEIAELNLRKARLARNSDISVGPSLEYSKSEQILGVSATIALPNKNYGRGEILTATAEQRKVQAETARLRREIIGGIATAAAKLDVAHQQLALYSPAYLDQLKAMVDVAEKSYAQNATSLLIYLDAKRTYFDALADYYEALANVARRRAELESAAGVPLESNLTTSDSNRP